MPRQVAFVSCAMLPWSKWWQVGSGAFPCQYWMDSLWARVAPSDFSMLLWSKRWLVGSVSCGRVGLVTIYLLNAHGGQIDCG